jgi:hypothetical protein
VATEAIRFTSWIWSTMSLTANRNLPKWCQLHRHKGPLVAEQALYCEALTCFYNLDILSNRQYSPTTFRWLNSLTSFYKPVKRIEKPEKSYRASGRLIVKSLLEYLVDVLWKRTAAKLLDILRQTLENTGYFGDGNKELSLLNIRVTNGIVGLSAGDSWTHKSPTWIHLRAPSGLSRVFLISKNPIIINDPFISKTKKALISSPLTLRRHH